MNIIYWIAAATVLALAGGIAVTVFEFIAGMIDLLTLVFTLGAFGICLAVSLGMMWLADFRLRKRGE